jgi:hypothetical protein
LLFYNKMSANNTQLSNPETYNVDKMRFSIAQKCEMKPENGPSIKYHRIPISTENEDGSFGEFVLSTTELFSFGVSENKNDSGKVTGYTLPLCLWNKEGASKAEKSFSDLLVRVCDRVKDHLILDDVRRSIGQKDLERSDLKKLGNFLYFKKDGEKNIIPGVGPILYPKLIESKKANKILTPMSDVDGNELDPRTLIGRMCWVRAVVKIESIYVGANPSIQIKLYEAEIRPLESGVKRLLQRPKAESAVDEDAEEEDVVPTKNASPPRVQQPVVDTANEDAEGSQIEDEDDAPAVSVPPPAPATPVRKVVRKVVPKK